MWQKKLMLIAGKYLTLLSDVWIMSKKAIREYSNQIYTSYFHGSDDTFEKGNSWVPVIPNSSDRECEIRP